MRAMFREPLLFSLLSFFSNTKHRTKDGKIFFFFFFSFLFLGGGLLLGDLSLSLSLFYSLNVCESVCGTPLVRILALCSFFEQSNVWTQSCPFTKTIE